MTATELAWPLFDPDWPADAEHDATLAATLGGKGRSLVRMHGWGLPVPAFLILPAPAIAAWLKPLRGRIEAALAGLSGDDAAAVARAAQTIAALIEALPLPAPLAETLVAACHQRFGAGFRVAVRSSAALEDGSADSFAGQFDSFLYVDETALAERVRACIASQYNARVLHYRLLRGIGAGTAGWDNGMAVVIQRMVDAARAGVMFTMNVGSNFNESAIVAAYGLGEGVVADRADTDHFFVARDSGRCYARLGEKRVRLDFDPVRGAVAEGPVAAGLHHAAVLDEAQLRRLSALGQRLEELYGQPQDVEFAFDAAGTLYLLQSRPITTLAGIDGDALVILDNANIIESYPGITLPLTYDFARRAYQGVFTAAARAFHLPEAFIRSNEALFANLLGYLNGRIYYQLHHARRIMEQVITSRAGRRAWQAFIGLSTLPWRSRTPPWRQRLRSLAVLAYLLVTYRRRNRRLFALFAARLAAIRAFVARLPDHDAAAIYRFFEHHADALFEAWAPTIVNDYFAMRSHALLERLVEGVGGDAELTNDLLCGIADVESEQPVIRLLELKRQVLADADLHALFRQEPAAIVARLPQVAPAPFLRQWAEYLERYGDRTLEELKLERPTLRMAPQLLAGLLRNQLDHPISHADLRRRQATVLEGAEQRLAALLRGRPLRRHLLGWVLGRAREAVRDRENMRINRARAFGAVKEMFHALGERMCAVGLLAAPADVYALRLEELRRFALEGAREPLQERVAAVRRAVEEQAGYDMPDRIIHQAGVPPDLSHYRKAAGGEAAAGATPGRLHGIGVSRGEAEGDALVLEAPTLAQRVDGQILVTRMTDPGWVFLMTQAAGIVSEKGSLLSHTAIVGRELGIPTVVGVEHATRLLRNGDRLALDGAAGTVTLLRRAPDREPAREAEQELEPAP